jgi:hypothetical protein
VPALADDAAEVTRQSNRAPSPPSAHLRSPASPIRASYSATSTSAAGFVCIPRADRDAPTKTRDARTDIIDLSDRSDPNWSSADDAAEGNHIRQLVVMRKKTRRARSEVYREPGYSAWGEDKLHTPFVRIKHQPRSPDRILLSYPRYQDTKIQTKKKDTTEYSPHKSDCPSDYDILDCAHPRPSPTGDDRTHPLTRYGRPTHSETSQVNPETLVFAEFLLDAQEALESCRQQRATVNAGSGASRPSRGTAAKSLLKLEKKMGTKNRLLAPTTPDDPGWATSMLNPDPQPGLDAFAGPSTSAAPTATGRVTHGAAH